MQAKLSTEKLRVAFRRLKFWPSMLSQSSRQRHTARNAVTKRGQKPVRIRLTALSVPLELIGEKRYGHLIAYYSAGAGFLQKLSKSRTRPETRRRNFSEAVSDRSSTLRHMQGCLGKV